MDQQNAKSSDPISGPGKALRQARLNRRLEIKDVANALNLPSRHLDALENDEYDKLPGPTYVRGYIRSYAHFLESSPEKMLELYNGLQVAAKHVDVTPRVAAVAKPRDSEQVVRYGGAILIAVVGGLAFLWWQSQDTIPPPSPAVIAPQEEELFPPSMDDTLPPEMDMPAPSTGRAAPSEEAVHPSVPASPAAIAPDVKPLADPVASDPQIPHARLVLYVLNESWADVRDAQNQKLLYATVPAGRVIKLEGVAPFSVFVGNAEGVRVEYNDRDFDFMRYRRGAVARFVVGEAPR